MHTVLPYLPLPVFTAIMVILQCEDGQLKWKDTLW